MMHAALPVLCMHRMCIAPAMHDARTQGTAMLLRLMRECAPDAVHRRACTQVYANQKDITGTLLVPCRHVPLQPCTLLLQHGMLYPITVARVWCAHRFFLGFLHMHSHMSFLVRRVWSSAPQSWVDTRKLPTILCVAMLPYEDMSASKLLRGLNISSFLHKHSR